MTALHPEIGSLAGRKLYRVPNDVMQVLAFSRSTTYEVIRSGRLRSVVEGNTRFVTEKAITDYIELLEREAQQNVEGFGRAA